MDGLAAWGWDERWAAAFESAGRAELLPARVVAQHRERWQLAAGDGEPRATLTGRFRATAGPTEFPVVGDWVGYLASSHGRGGDALIDLVLARRSRFLRRAAGPRLVPQVLAANVDTLLVASSFDRDLNRRRLERYVAMARQGGAEPVVLLTKTDLATDPAPASAELAAALGVRVVAISARTGAGLGELAPLLRPGLTLALAGSSGVGKSTLLNLLAGTAVMATGEVREDDRRGRHTTTHRELFRLPGGALLLDTPGLRELGLWDAEAGLGETFARIGETARDCRFSDCRHEHEPGCAVRRAIEAGELEPESLHAYRRLAAELAGQPVTFAERLATRSFRRAIRNAAADSAARKTYRER